MLYHLFRYLDEAYDLPGSGMFQYISFRAAAAIILSLLIVIIFGRSIIDFLRRKQIGEEIRDLGLQGQLQKKGTPTMGGVIILVAILVPMLLVGNLGNVYVRLMLVSTVWLGLLGFLDDYIKVFRHNKEGLKGKFKIVFQPAEEGVRGARPMTETGIFDDVDFFFGNHLGFNLPTGTISPEPGVFLASTKLDATFTGLAAHSGADPQKGKNALLAGAAAALAVHGITRPIGEVTALNVGTLVAGQGRNVVAPNAFMQLEVRGETEELNAYMRDQAIRKIKASADMYDCQVDIVKAGEATEFKPDQEAIELAYIAARNVTTEDLARPLGLKLGSEDCTIMLRRVQQHGGKGTFVVFGCRTSAGHHQRLFDFDEDVIGIALRFYQNLIPMIVGIK